MTMTPRTDAALEADSEAGSTKELVALCRELEQAKRKLLLDLWDALPGHEATDDPMGTLRGTLLMSEVGDEIRETRMGR